ncbi:uncharacterized protein LOC135216624 [Macrobrachium nipponense]|uniref:uncharacterized protein LOC135216624 n=1 Tax=Macrobrachium nipponense TaxID=159736 RepID=UPI0030C81EE3
MNPRNLPPSPTLSTLETPSLSTPESPSLSTPESLSLSTPESLSLSIPESPSLFTPESPESPSLSTSPPSSTSPSPTPNAPPTTSPPPVSPITEEDLDGYIEQLEYEYDSLEKLIAELDESETAGGIKINAIRQRILKMRDILRKIIRHRKAPCDTRHLVPYAVWPGLSGPRVDGPQRGSSSLPTTPPSSTIPTPESPSLSTPPTLESPSLSTPPLSSTPPIPESHSLSNSSLSSTPPIPESHSLSNSPLSSTPPIPESHSLSNSPLSSTPPIPESHSLSTPPPMPYFIFHYIYYKPRKYRTVVWNYVWRLTSSEEWEESSYDRQPHSSWDWWHSSTKTRKPTLTTREELEALRKEFFELRLALLEETVLRYQEQSKLKAAIRDVKFKLERERGKHLFPFYGRTRVYHHKQVGGKIRSGERENRERKTQWDREEGGRRRPGQQENKEKRTQWDREASGKSRLWEEEYMEKINTPAPRQYIPWTTATSSWASSRQDYLWGKTSYDRRSESSWDWWSKAKSSPKTRTPTRKTRKELEALRKKVKRLRSALELEKRRRIREREELEDVLRKLKMKLQRERGKKLFPCLRRKKNRKRGRKRAYHHRRAGGKIRSREQKSRERWMHWDREAGEKSRLLEQDNMEMWAQWDWASSRRDYLWGETSYDRRSESSWDWWSKARSSPKTGKPGPTLKTRKELEALRKKKSKACAMLLN